MVEMASDSKNMHLNLQFLFIGHSVFDPSKQTNMFIFSNGQ